MNPRLIGVSGPLEGTVCVLPEGEFTIGRDAANQLWVDDAALSRRHCVKARFTRCILRSFLS
jgi:pSer/pThr/pTyr-binding forkhead associated (FHA) protein